MNFLQETLDILKALADRGDSVLFIGSRDGKYSCSYEEFLSLANFDYNEDYGAAEVPRDLVIVFDSGSMLVREEYDGSEWWRLQSPFTMPEYSKKITSLYKNGEIDINVGDINE